MVRLETVEWSEGLLGLGLLGSIINKKMKYTQYEYFFMQYAF